jgi:hypothetical protein
MPKIVSPVSDLYWTLDRPVVYELVRDLMELTQISNKTPISFFGDEDKQSQVGSTVDAGQAQNRWPYDERVTIEVEEVYDENSLGSTAVTRTEHMPFIQDNDLGVSVRPVYVATTLNIIFKYRARDRNQANRWRNDRRMRTSQGQECTLHDITYHYRLPTEQLAILREIHALRENVAGYGQDFNTYLTSIASRNFGLVTNQAARDATWVVHESQVRVVGTWDYTGTPEKAEKDGEADAWTVGFAYKVQYQKPLGCMIAYPVIIHNQVIGTDYRPPEPSVKKIEDAYSRRSISGGYLQAFETDSRMLLLQGDIGITLPAFDDWLPMSVTPTTVKVFTAAVLVDPSRPRYLFNLADLGEVRLKDDILDLIRTTEYAYLSSDYASIFNLTLYRDMRPATQVSCYVDANLDVWASADLDLRKMYHVRFSLVTNFNYLTTFAIKRLQSKPVAGTLINVINTSLRSLNVARRDIKSDRLDDIDMRSVLGKSVNLEVYRGGQMWTVQTLFVTGAKSA